MECSKKSNFHLVFLVSFCGESGESLFYLLLPLLKYSYKKIPNIGSILLPPACLHFLIFTAPTVINVNDFSCEFKPDLVNVGKQTWQVFEGNVVNFTVNMVLNAVNRFYHRIYRNSYNNLPGCCGEIL